MLSICQAQAQSHVQTSKPSLQYCNPILSEQTNYESGIKELSAEFRVRLQEELTQREAVEKQLDKQNGLKNHMELCIQNLEEDVEEKKVDEKRQMKE